MAYKSVLSRAGKFVSGLATEPVDTLQTSWRGLREGSSHLETHDKITAPVFLGLGATLTAMGAANLNPVHILAGAFELAIAGGIYLDAGRQLPPQTPPSPPLPS